MSPRFSGLSSWVGSGGGGCWVVLSTNWGRRARAKASEANMASLLYTFLFKHINDAAEKTFFLGLRAVLRGRPLTGRLDGYSLEDWVGTLRGGAGSGGR